MTLYDRLLNQGRRLFASRSIMPILLVPFILLALRESAEVESWLGAKGTLILQWTSVAVALCGLLMRCITVAFAADGTSARDTRGMRASALNTTGMYSIVRHPLYLGAGLMWIGVAMSTRVWWLVVIVGLAYWLYIERVALTEESFLAATFPGSFRQWAAATPAFIPRLRLWVAPSAGFQLKRLLSEHNGLLAVAIMFPALELLEDLGRGESLKVWYADHFDLVEFALVAAVVSLIAIVLRRSLNRDSAEPVSVAAETCSLIPDP